MISTVSSYVINPNKYVATIWNRVDALQNFAKDQNLQQLFLTLTLPTEYHRYKNIQGKKVTNMKFAHAHLELYDIFTKMRAQSFMKLILKYYKTCKKNKWSGKMEKTSLNKDDYSVRKGCTHLLNIFARVRKDRAWTDIGKEDRIFFSVIEPTENLTAHIHISAWVSKDRISRLIKAFFRFYPHPLTHIYTSEIPKELKEVTGLEKSDKDIVNYLLKYLDNLEDENEEVSDLVLWYFAHKITPFSCSRSLIPEDIYRKLRGDYTLYDATKKYRVSAIHAWNNAKNKKLMKVFKQDKIIWTKTPCSLHTDVHPIGSSNSEEKEHLWEK